ncbi:hypothetical protein KCH_76070 [Kitasatospora cheerisanensis KCTC 2395]|uniref:Uncharacterized protein n=1 Tax=Kitasatospora cheerisanensis KCTC 2395 TaxID=1348663 RepID=A0A066YRD3_9ACTN|nr:hypothetical protein KCH_76070 [Kitasatospora cheerisanensis KCTC 2395]
MGERPELPPGLTAVRGRSAPRPGVRTALPSAGVRIPGGGSRVVVGPW